MKDSALDINPKSANCSALSSNLKFVALQANLDDVTALSLNSLTLAENRAGKAAPDGMAASTSIPSDEHHASPPQTPQRSNEYATALLLATPLDTTKPGGLCNNSSPFSSFSVIANQQSRQSPDAGTERSAECAGVEIEGGDDVAEVIRWWSERLERSGNGSSVQVHIPRHLHRTWVLMVVTYFALRSILEQ